MCGIAYRIMTETEVKQELRQQVAEKTLAYVASELKVSISYLHDVVRGRRRPGRKILRGLGLERKVEYVKQ
jgi:hypothetical protein